MSSVVASSVEIPIKPRRFPLPLEARKELCLKDWKLPHMPQNLVVCITTDGASNLPKQMTTNKVSLEFVVTAANLD